jgi:hypothetical protein
MPSLSPGSKSARPVSVIVLSVIGILLGAGSLLCSPLTLLSLLVDFGVPNPQLDAMKTDPLLKAWTWYGVVSLLVFGAWALIGSVGSLILKRWGRSTMVTYAIVQTTLTIAGTAVTFAVVQPRMKAALGERAAALQPAWTSYLQLGIGVALLAYFLSVWFCFTRPHVIDAFEAAEAGAV